MGSVSSITQCRVLYEYIKRIGDRRKKWIKYANQIGIKSFCLTSTMDICNNMLKWMDRVSYSYYAEEEILKAFDKLGTDAVILKAYFEHGHNVIKVAYPSERTGYRRLQGYSNRVLRYCDEKVIQYVFKDANLDAENLYRQYGNKAYRV